MSNVANFVGIANFLLYIMKLCCTKMWEFMAGFSHGVVCVSIDNRLRFIDGQI